MPYTSSRGVKIYHESYGTGVPLVFLAPLAANGYIWHHQVFAFARTNRCILIDARGHSRSEKPDGGYNVPQLAEDVLAVLDDLAINKAVLVGNSIGGMAAMQFNLDHPDRVRGNVLAGTATNMGANMPKEVMEAFQRDPFNMFCGLMDTAVADHTRRERPEILTTMRSLLTNEETFPRRVFFSFLSDPEGPFAWNIASRLGDIHAPTLVLVGAEDRATPVEANQFLAASIPGAQFSTIPDAGHFSELENPAAFNERLAQFLGSLG